MTKLYLIRHAEAEGNVYRRIHGQYDSMITPNGQKQIAALKKRFENVPIDAVYASDLTRTCITAGALYKPKQLELHRDPRFREVNLGVWEDTPFGQLEHDEKERLYAFSHDSYHWSVEGGETIGQYAGRFLVALDEVARRHNGQSVAIFSHGMVLRGAMLQLFFPGEDAAVSHCENTAVTELTWEDGIYHLDLLNDDSHITPEISTLGRQNWWRGDRYQDFNMWFRQAEETDHALLTALDCRPLMPGDRVRIAMLRDTPAGVVVTRRCDDETGGLVYLALLPEHRGIGLAAQLLGEAVCSLRASGAKWLELLAPVTEEGARRLFQSYGFEDSRLYIVPTF